MTSPYASKDLFFEKALKSLPTALLESMIAADLTNPGVLRLYPRYSPAELGLLPEIVHVDLEDTAQSCTVSSNFSQSLLHIGTAAAAELTSSCHELGVVSLVSCLRLGLCLFLCLLTAIPRPMQQISKELRRNSRRWTKGWLTAIPCPMQQISKELRRNSRRWTKGWLTAIPRPMQQISEDLRRNSLRWTMGPLTAIPRPVHQISPELQLRQTLSRHRFRKVRIFPLKWGVFRGFRKNLGFRKKSERSPLVSGLSNLDGGVAIKPVRGSGSENLRAESSSNGSLEDSSTTRSMDEEEPRVRQVETQTTEVMAKNVVRDSPAKPPPHMRAWKTGTTRPTTQSTTTQSTEAAVKKSLRDASADFQQTAKVQKVQATQQAHRQQEPPDFLTLYHSLVRDGVLPQGFGEAFSSLELTVNLAADRQDVIAASVSNLQSVGWIDARYRQVAQLTNLRRQPQTSFSSQPTRPQDGSEPSSNKGGTKARTRGRKPRNLNGRSGLNSWVRCCLTRPRRWVRYSQRSPATSSYWAPAAEQQHSGHVSGQSNGSLTGLQCLTSKDTQQNSTISQGIYRHANRNHAHEGP